jgi:thiamine biosynthesis lipoprotein ApbE
MKKNASILFFAIVLFGVVFQSCGNKTKTDEGLVGRDYDRDFLGVKYTISVVGDTTDYSFAFDSIENAVRMHIDASNPNSTCMLYNCASAESGFFEFTDYNRIMGVMVTMAREFNYRSGGCWDFTLSPAQVAWLPQLLNPTPKVPNIDSLKVFTGMYSANVDVEDVEENGVYKSTRIRKNNPKVQIDLQKFGSALVLDKIIEYLKEKNATVKQAVVKTDVWQAGFGAAVDSLNVLDMKTSGQKTGNLLRVVNRAYATFDARNKLSLLDPKTLSPVQNEMYQSYVSAKTIVESYVFAEAFMVMGVEGIGAFYEANVDSDIQSLVYFMKSDSERASASTENFNKMMVASSAQ